MEEDVSEARKKGPPKKKATAISIRRKDVIGDKENMLLFKPCGEKISTVYFLDGDGQNAGICQALGMRYWRRVVLTMGAVSLLIGSWWIYGWIAPTTPLSSRGGLWFPRAVLHDVPHFAQADKRWGKQHLGATSDTLAGAGCAVTSAAMILAAYGAELDPGQLNVFLQSHNGYTEQGWLYWEKAAIYPPGLAELAYEDAPSYFLIDWNLLRGNPVIVRLRYPSGITHFVVIVGKSGFDYLIRDPGAGFAKGIYFLSEFGSPIEALRFYRRTSALINGK